MQDSIIPQDLVKRRFHPLLTQMPTIAQQCAVGHFCTALTPWIDDGAGKCSRAVCA
jgi:hypothetical protein